MSNYQYLIFDVDDTLLDFAPAFATAQRNIAQRLGIELSKEYFEADEKCGWKAWEENTLNIYWRHTEKRMMYKNLWIAI